MAQDALEIIPFWNLLLVVLSGHSKHHWTFWMKGAQGHFPGSKPNPAMLFLPGLLVTELALKLCLYNMVSCMVISNNLDLFI